MITLRGTDFHGSGAFGASRGNRTHNGVDIVTHANESVIAYEAGIVTKIGFPYSQEDDKKSRYRYIEITNGDNRLRYFYCGVLVELGDRIDKGQTIGWSQDLDCAYPGITQHLHFEVKDKDGKFINPVEYLKELGYELAG